jgi:hypothetical protein
MVAVRIMNRMVAAWVALRMISIRVVPRMIAMRVVFRMIHVRVHFCVVPIDIVLFVERMWIFVASWGRRSTARSYFQFMNRAVTRFNALFLVFFWIAVTSAACLVSP